MGEIARRTAKTVTNADGSVTNITYHTAGGSPLGESRITTLNGETVSTVEIQYVYDASGTAYGISAFVTDAENNTTQYNYYYMHNLQGDVIGLWHQYAGPVCYYTYDAWGKLLSVTDANGNAITDANHIAHINPLRYRGYYYDTESALYYLQSRYYDPEVGRFINGDVLLDQSSIVGNNIFAYCLNNPIMFSDLTGLCVELWNIGIQGPCPGIGRCPDLPVFRDVTDEINRALTKEIEKRRGAYAAGWLKSIFLGLRSLFIDEYMMKPLDFYKLVKEKAPWDIKEKESWDNTIGTIFPGKDVPVIYRGRWMTPEHLGNYTYGYLGAAYGFSFLTLLGGSYYAADFPVRGNAFTNEVSDWVYIALGYRQYSLDNR